LKAIGKRKEPEITTGNIFGQMQGIIFKFYLHRLCDLNQQFPVIGMAVINGKHRLKLQHKFKKPGS
jgi:hypothetical protein